MKPNHNINKEELLQKLISQVEKELAVAIQAARTAHEDATNEESKPENEYDTRALEASYVARGQAKRVADLKEMLFEFKRIKIKNFDDNEPITATAFIAIESEQNKIQNLFFLPLGGGFSVELDGVKVQVVTPSTPLGQALLQTKLGDIIQVNLGAAVREYEIISVQ